MKIKMLLLVTVIGVIWMVGCSAQNPTQQNNVLSGQGTIAEMDDDKNDISINPGESSNEQVDIEKENAKNEMFTNHEEFQNENMNMGTENSLEDELCLLAADFAIYFPQAFASTADLNPTRFVLFKLYENAPDNIDEEGIFWVTLDELAEEVYLRFGISDYTFESPARGNVYPRYIKEKKAIAFYPVGEWPSYLADFISCQQDREDFFYTFDIYDNFITDGHEEKTLEKRICYYFRLVEDSEKKPRLQAVSALEVE